mgnify:CR=1 FL=1
MDFLQNILAYFVLSLAIGYLMYKFILPKSLLRPKKAKSDKACGSQDCGCH